jgi:phage-related protein
MERKRAKRGRQSIMPYLGEYSARLAEMVRQASVNAQTMQSHIEADAKAFAELIAQLTEVNKDVKTLLESRSRMMGMVSLLQWGIASGLIVAVGALLWKVFVK